MRGSNMPKGQAAEAGQQEVLLQSASALRGGCMSRGLVAKAVQQEVMQQPAGANKRRTGGGRWRWHVERQGCAKRMSGGGNATTSRTSGKGGHGMTRGNGMMRGGDTGRWEAVA